MNIPDELLTNSGLSGDELRVEIACLLFDAGKLTLFKACQLACLSRTELESELLRRNIPLHRPSLEDLKVDLASLDKLQD